MDSLCSLHVLRRQVRISSARGPNKSEHLRVAVEWIAMMNGKHVYLWLLLSLLNAATPAQTRDFQWRTINH
jgi:hypothetical protein